MVEAPEWFERILDLQLERNPEMLADLQRSGIDLDVPLRLEFLYLAPGEPEARELVAFLRLETDYVVRAFERREGMSESRPWFVVGITQPTPLSLELLNEWSQWMVAAGATYGPCAFDSWSAETADG